METLNTHRKKGKGINKHRREEINTKKKNKELKHNSDGWFFE